jgi:hypothetical protein
VILSYWSNLMALSQKLRLKKISTWIWATTTFIFSTLYFFTVAALDPEPLHDGIQLTPAIAVFNGLRIHDEVFEQYGPLNVWFHAFSLKAFGETLLSLRYQTALLLVIGAILMFLFLRMTISSAAFAAILVIYWILNCPISAAPQGDFGLWPWPSTLSLVLQLMNGILILQIRAGKLTKVRLALASLCCALLFYVRIQSGIMLIIIDFIILYIAFRKSTQMKNYFYTFFFQLAFYFSLLTILLIRFSSIESFFKQIVIGPARYYSKKIDLIYWVPSYIVVSLGIITTLLIIGKIQHRKSTHYIIRLFFGLLISVFICFSMQNFFNKDYTSWSNYLDRDMKQFGFLSLCAIISIFQILLLLLRHISIFSRKSKFYSYSYLLKNHEHNLQINKDNKDLCSQIEDGSAKYFSTLLAVPPIFQLYPLPDVYHLWWSAPLLIPLAIQSAQKKFSIEILFKAVSVAIFPSIILLSVAYQHHLNIPRTEITHGVLLDMKIRTGLSDSYQGISTILNPVQPNSTRFMCKEALFASWTAQYLSVDGNYVSWAWWEPVSSFAKQPTGFVLCASSLEEAQAKAESLNSVIKGPGIPYIFSIYSKGIMYRAYSTNNS